MQRLFTLILLLTVSLSARAADPTYAPVKAELFHARDGLAHVKAKLEAGRTVRIAYLGGSITAMNGWRNKTTDWFAKQYPKAKIEEIHAAIGGTGSDLGVFRLEHDVLDHKPDLLFVEFAVNDGGAAPEQIWKAMEGIVRQTWRANPDIDICYTYTIHEGMLGDLKQGLCPRSTSAMEMLADHYGIPSINFEVRVAQLFEAGKLIMKPPAQGDAPAGVIVFSKEGVHPFDAGHEVYLQVIDETMPQVLAASKSVDHAAQLAGVPFIEGNYENAKIEPVTESMLSGHWTKLPTDKGLGKIFSGRMGDIWEADTPGDKISFDFKGSYAALYDLLGPDGGQVTITVDGQSRGPVARFDHYCTYHRIATLRLADGLDPNQVHHVTVEIAPGQPDRSSVTDKEKDKPGFDPKRYDGTRIRIGGVMLIGDLAH
ncbi:MAG: SGNH/GDSL hydrolase family protein [Planctomycetes bacterium]|nr:SGNH/GDSL hydrolase family protein [Planctomycetota bacterium]